MHDHPKGGDDDPAFITTYEEDDREQWALLRQVLQLHPATLTQDELVRELNGGRPREFCEVDRVERAIRELAGTGLLHRPGEEEMVQPTRSALRYFELSGEAT
jgi:hypothetical protein